MSVLAHTLDLVRCVPYAASLLPLRCANNWADANPLSRKQGMEGALRCGDGELLDRSKCMGCKTGKGRARELGVKRKHYEAKKPSNAYLFLKG